MPKVKRKAVAATNAPAKSRSSPRTKAKSKVEADKTRKATASTARIARLKPVFFCDPDTSDEGGFLSPWLRSRFEIKGVVYQKAGHYIVAEKARAFGDKKALQRILEAETTEELKSLGDSISGVDEKTWRRRVTRIAKTANTHKFTSDNTESRELLKRLKKLGNRELVFADPSDAVLGIGFNAADAEEVGREQWGANVFGKALDAVREQAKAKGKKANATRKQTSSQAAPRHGDLDTSIFDVGGRMSINW
ncbi:hypothetical protein FB567DRAFT_357023 [Paraphoma chrysanthemicola]|uniref:NADAR domain-containing protein n=1 Tax=Paraphoma chrysanthemicola TaxID=798071 RepID=A0A8K0R669_9PLEO|nr:hypothetical protein FB567DRAFT_357023 [Paraphoma chrysanthemicola]